MTEQDQKTSADELRISLMESVFRYHLLHDIGLVVHDLLYDDVYSREDAVKDLLKVMKSIEMDKPELPASDGIQTDR